MVFYILVWEARFYSGEICSPTTGLPHALQLATSGTWQLGHKPTVSVSRPHFGQTYLTDSIALPSSLLVTIVICPAGNVKDVAGKYKNYCKGGARLKPAVL